MNTIYSDSPIQTAAEHLALVIKDRLASGQRVLWLLSGGSGVKVVLAVDKLLRGADLSNLYVTLSDERFGIIGHHDENWQQLLDGGMTFDGAHLYRPLTGDDIVTTTDKFGAWVMQQMTSVDYRIGIFGIGADGHTAGIKPHSPAAVATAWAEQFTGDDFERLTITPFAISQMDEIVLQVSGVEKEDALRKLVHESAEMVDEPAQIVKSVSKCTLYTDIKEI